MSEELFEELTPFEKTALLEIARTQALASAAFQLVSAAPGEVLPQPQDILRKALADQMSGILQTLSDNSN